MLVFAMQFSKSAGVVTALSEWDGETDLRQGQEKAGAFSKEGAGHRLTHLAESGLPLPQNRVENQHASASTRCVSHRADRMDSSWTVTP